MTSSPATLRDLLLVTDDYASFNREERNYSAILYHLLLKPGGLARFLQLIGHREVDPASTRLYFEYAHARDLWCEFGVRCESMDARNQAYHAAIVSLLQAPDGLLPPATDVVGFNRFFVGEPPRASKLQIQMPGRWSQAQFEHWVDKGGSEFARRACMLKWSFNVKPDLVIQTSSDTAICVEIKVVSAEGKYSVGKGSQPFSSSQTATQKYVLETLLGYKTEFVFLSRDGRVPNEDEAAAGMTPTAGLTWTRVFTELMPPDVSDELPFVREMAGSPLLLKPRPAWNASQQLV